MSVIERIYQEHQDLAGLLKKYSGLRKHFQSIYPDTAHFIYELIQNAEDTGASETLFILSENLLVFQHNGRSFNEEDIWGITKIAEGTKEDDIEQIGCFGIGFKSVFAYTNTPRIYSPTYSFKIKEMVLPEEISPIENYGEFTRFEFPLNSSKKPQSKAFEEIRSGLKDISDNTLLHLSNINEINWRVKDEEYEGLLLRNEHTDNHIEILRQYGNSIKNSHFLRFAESTKAVERQNVAIAFELEARPDDKQNEEPILLRNRFRIVSASNGSVAAFFTAKKETSNLRFHIHGPFFTEPSRSSITESQENSSIVKRIARLTVQSLFEIRELGLLDRDFLEVLPNSHDSIPSQYRIIMREVQDAMINQSLTPTYNGGHAPASQLLQAESSLKEILNQRDLSILVCSDDMQHQWAISATQKNSSIDRFLNDLNIAQCGIKEILSLLSDSCSQYHFARATNQTKEFSIINWLNQKPIEWYRKFYTLLDQVPSLDSAIFENLYIVKRSDGSLGLGKNTYFPTREMHEDQNHPRVAAEIYLDGTKTEQQRSRSFLEGIGVREVGEFEEIETILNHRYIDPEAPPPIETNRWEIHKSDLERFIDFLENRENEAYLFENYFIFYRSDLSWSKPSEVYLDAPYLESGLSAYYEKLQSKRKPATLSDVYSTHDLHKKFVSFAQKCGVIHYLGVVETTCRFNPNKIQLAAEGSRFTKSGIDSDFHIPELEDMFKQPTLALSTLVWNTLHEQSQDKNFLIATYRNNQRYETQTTDSSLVHHLQHSHWIPQSDGHFVQPCKALRDELPENFVYASGWNWLKAIKFGENTEKMVERRSRRVKAAEELGICESEISDAMWFIRLSTQERQNIQTNYKSLVELPMHEPINPCRRADVIRNEIKAAPERATEIRPRSVSVDREQLKREKTDPYLRHFYTNPDGITICQACKSGLPFKVTGRYYFEMTECINGFNKLHYQNYLALCPNHSAMFKHANNFKENMKGIILNLEKNYLELTLADQAISLYFNPQHLADLKEVIRVEEDKK